jgi:hypothetical protein
MTFAVRRWKRVGWKKEREKGREREGRKVK